MVAYTEKGEYKFYLDKSKDDLLKLGIKQIDFFNLREDKFEAKKDYDVIYLCGGDTFAIMERMKLIGFDKFMKKMARRKNVLCFAVSAGSIVAGPNIESALWGTDGDENRTSLKDLTGLKLTNISVFPHFRKEIKKEVEEFAKTVKYPVIGLNDKEAVFIDGKEHKIIR
jgi:peptidase E